MASVVTTGSGTRNVVARTSARRMVSHAVGLNNEEKDTILPRPDEDDSDEEEGALDELDRELLRLGDDPYDSDDPRSFGGEYYWDYAPARPTALARRISDCTRWALFHVVRFLGFIFLVMQHFFGLDRSRFQWAVDLVERETAARDARTLARTNKSLRD